MTLHHLSDDTLDDVLAGDEPDYSTDPAEFVLAGIEQADAMAYRLGLLRSALAADCAAADARIGQILAWLDRRKAAHGSKIAWLEAALRHYHEMRLARDKRAKTVRLPSATLKSRVGRVGWDVDDEAVLAWALDDETVAALDAAQDAYRAQVQAVLDGLGDRGKVLKVAPPRDPQFSLSGLQAVATRRDDDGRAVAWGVLASGERVPGVKIIPAERNYEIVVTDDEQIDDEQADERAADEFETEAS